MCVDFKCKAKNQCFKNFKKPSIFIEMNNGIILKKNKNDFFFKKSQFSFTILFYKTKTLCDTGNLSLHYNRRSAQK